MTNNKPVLNMSTKKIEFAVKVPNWMVPVWWKVAYKIPPTLVKEIGDIIRVRPDAKFNKVVSEHLRAFVEKGKMPPKEIEVPILNLANDFADGREMIIRTGDYIALQTFVRSSG